MRSFYQSSTLSTEENNKFMLQLYLSLENKINLDKFINIVI